MITTKTLTNKAVVIGRDVGIVGVQAVTFFYKSNAQAEADRANAATGPGVWVVYKPGRAFYVAYAASLVIGRNCLAGDIKK